VGSNLGDRSRTIGQALLALRGSEGIAGVEVSSLVETDPVGPGVQEKYLNQVWRVETSLAPRALLERLLAIERDLGRVRVPGEKWGPRTIDLDVLLFGDAVIDEPGLAVPHPRMHERRFVLEPLAEIAPDVVHPVRKKSVREMLNAL
jgi:2-amino-4-hydroxy-6-hydroxymethyldihydropteridine diphosphokinase